MRGERKRPTRVLGTYPKVLHVFEIPVRRMSTVSITFR